MSSRGQRRFSRLSQLGARNYERLTSGPAAGSQYKAIAREIASLVPKGRLLDVGTGPGRMLGELRGAAPGLELHGVDISEAMIDLARSRLGSGVELRVAPADATGYDSGYFDAVACSKSLYLWDDPERCLAEIHRILKPGGAAFLYETFRDYDRDAVIPLMNVVFSRERLLVRLLGPGLMWRQLSETYSREELRVIAEQSPFGSCEIELAPTILPVWARVTLRKA